MVESPDSRRIHAVCVFLACASLLAVLAARVAGPSDVWDHAQPRTLSYTTDIVVHGGSHWILPFERDETAASKPPMYNWIAAPWVQWLGTQNELAHRMPSVLAFLACWLALMHLGRRIGGQDGVMLGAIAATVFVANLLMTKLCIIVRPDMVLTAFVFAAWLGATAQLERRFRGDAPRLLWSAMFWIGVIAGGLTKGPVALIPVIYALLIPRLAGGRWSDIPRLHWISGLIALATIAGGWLLLVARIDPDHLRSILIGEEIVGRVSGSGPRGSRGGPMDLLRTAPYIFGYYVVRQLPWALIVPLVVWSTWRSRRTPLVSRIDRWTRCALVFTACALVIFTLSAGKRADYVSITTPMLGLIAGHWITIRLRPDRVRSVIAYAVVVVATVTVSIRNEWVGTSDPPRDFGDRMMQLVADVDAIMVAEPRPLYCTRLGNAPVPALLGVSAPVRDEPIEAAIERGEPCYVLSGWRDRHFEIRDYGPELKAKYPSVSIEAIADSGEMTRGYGWSGRATLYKVTPPEAGFSSQLSGRSDNPSER
ncbi:MAG: glycosyltransferase family 39 protein [Planctomycetota bacterium]